MDKEASQSRQKTMGGGQEVGPFGDHRLRTASKTKAAAAGVKNSYKPSSSKANVLIQSFTPLSNGIRKFHFIFGILATICFLLTPSMRDGIEKHGWLSLTYFAFEIALGYFCKSCLKETKYFPVNYISLVLIRCFLFFNTQHRLTIDSFFPDPSPLSFSSWNGSDLVAMMVMFFVIIPAIVAFTKIYIGNYHVLCLVGTNVSSTLAVLLLLTSMGLDSSNTTSKMEQLQDEDHLQLYHFRLCLLWILISFIMTFVNVLSIFQRIVKSLKKEIPLYEVGQTLLEFYIMILSFGFTFPYIRLVHPNLHLTDLFPKFDHNGKYVEDFVWLSMWTYSCLGGYLESGAEIWCWGWKAVVVQTEIMWGTTND